MAGGSVNADLEKRKGAWALLRIMISRIRPSWIARIRPARTTRIIDRTRVHILVLNLVSG
jgi:hypothetical protein